MIFGRRVNIVLRIIWCGYVINVNKIFLYVGVDGKINVVFIKWKKIKELSEWWLNVWKMWN